MSAKHIYKRSLKEKRKPRATRAALLLPENQAGSLNSSPPTIFISYRRQDSKDAATYLRALLSRQFGAEKIFRDLDSLKPGADFPSLISSTISAARVFIPIIGKTWLSVTGPDGKPRIFAKYDLVRTEIESALRLGIDVIPVYLDGVKPLQSKELPKSIGELANKTAIELSWFDGVSKLRKQISEIEKRKANEESAAKKNMKKLRLNISLEQRFKSKAGWGRSVIVTAMEFSLKRQRKKIILDEKDFHRSLEKVTAKSLRIKSLRKSGAFMFEDMIYVVDMVGVKEKGSNRRFVARTFPLRSLEELPLQLTLKRPVICGFLVYQDWFDERRTGTGIIDFDKPSGAIQGGTVGVITGWDPVTEKVNLLTPWPAWGKRGVATLTKGAVVSHIQTQYLRSVEAVEMPRPYKWPD
jgi:TIR domain-containing protein